MSGYSPRFVRAYLASLPNSGPIFKASCDKFDANSYKVFQYALFSFVCVAHDNDCQPSALEKLIMAAFMNASYETPGERRPLEAVGAAFARAFVNAGRDAPAAPRRREAVGAAFARAFATWTAPTTLARPNATLAPLDAVFRDLPLELTAKCIMGAMGLRWKHVCDKIRKHSYAIQEGQYLMPPLEYPVFEPVRSSVLRTIRHRRDPFARAGLLAGIRPRLLRHHLRPREGRATKEEDVSMIKFVH